MGKNRTKIVGTEEEEKKQKAEQKARSSKKKTERKKDKVEETIKSQPAVVPPKGGTLADKKKKVIVQKIRGKKYTEARTKVDKKKAYSLDEAIKLLKKIKYTKFDEAVELHFTVDKTGLKGELDLPHSTGKTTRVVIVDDKVLSDIEKGRFDFDILITHPSYMPKLAKFAKTLGPKGLMPNPKAGTISAKPEEVAKKFTKGMLRWKTEVKFPLIHQMIGKISLDDKALVENAAAFVGAVGTGHILHAFIKTTMSPSLKLNLEKLL